MAKAIASVANYDPFKTNIDGDVEHVLDGGRLIHLIKWQKTKHLLTFTNAIQISYWIHTAAQRLCLAVLTCRPRRTLLIKNRIVGHQVLDFTPSMKITTSKIIISGLHR